MADPISAVVTIIGLVKNIKEIADQVSENYACKST